MTNQETLAKYLTDMLALEDHVAQPLRSQAKDSDFAPYPAARSLVQRILISSEFAQSELENTAKAMGAEAQARGSFKSAVAAVAGVAAAVINEGRTDPITKKLRDDYAALSLCAIGYELLHAAGNALGSPHVAALAQKRLHEVAGFIMALSQEIIPVSLRELAKTNAVDLTTMNASQQNVKAAWTP